MSSLTSADYYVQDTQGNALAGALVYYLVNQPGSTSATVNLTTLALIYSDSGGGTAVTNPVITDGFGRANTGYADVQPYILAGVYTVVAIINGTILDVVNDYPVSQQVVTTYPPRTTAIVYTIDGGGNVVTSGVKGQVQMPLAGTVTGWVLTGDQFGSAVVDVLRSTYAGFPTTVSIASTDKPTLASAQKNENLAVSTWTTALNAGDEIQFNVVSATTVTRLNLTIILTVSG